LPVFAIAWLFSDEKNRGMGSPLPKDDLGRFSIQVASATFLCRFSQAPEVVAGREEFQG
jgi:hypothetical protein